MNYQHKILGVGMINVSKLLARIDSSSFKNSKVREGLDLTVKMLNIVLYKYGFIQFKPSPKEKFNKLLH